ncbi:MAG: potassium channel family protein [Geminicoccaceae bacterium]
MSVSVLVMELLVETPNLLLGGFMIAVTVFLQAGAQSLLIGPILRSGRRFMLRHAPKLMPLALVIISALVLFAAHVTQIWVWAILYMGLGEFADLTDALYFSTTTFTTVGYGDVIIENSANRLLASFESANGMLLFGWSTALLFKIISTVYSDHFERLDAEG